MLISDTALGDFALSDFDIAFSEAVPDALETILAKPYLDREWLVTSSPLDSIPFGLGGLVPLKYSTGGHTTPSGEATTQYPQRVISPYEVASELDDLSGLVRNSDYNAVLDNTDRGITLIAGYEWTGRDITTKLGPLRGATVQFATVFKGKTRAATVDRDSITIITDSMQMLLDAQVQTNRYSGAGGLNGGAELKGRPRPLLYGQRYRFKPILVDPANNIYQVHDGSVNQIGIAEVNGVALSFDADYANITTATPGAGEYATSIAQGYIKLGATPDGVVIVRYAEGDDSSSLGYVDTIADLVTVLSIKAGFSHPADFDLSAFSALTDTKNLGVYISGDGTESTTISDVIDGLLSSCGCWLWVTPAGILTIGSIQNPDGLTPDFSVSESGLAESDISIGPPELIVYKVTVGYREFTPLTETEVDPSVSASDRANFITQWRYESSEDSSVLASTPDAIELVLYTNLVDSADALALSAAQLALRKVKRYRYEVPYPDGLIRVGIGDIVQLTDSSVPEYHALIPPNKNCIAIGIRSKARSQGSPDDVTLTCYG